MFELHSSNFDGCIEGPPVNLDNAESRDKNYDVEEDVYEIVFMFPRMGASWIFGTEKKRNEAWDEINRRVEYFQNERYEFLTANQ